MSPRTAVMRERNTNKTFCHNLEVGVGIRTYESTNNNVGLSSVYLPISFLRNMIENT